MKEGQEETHTGYIEGGLLGAQAAASYFLLVPHDNHFIAVPVKEWYNFKPALRCTAPTLFLCRVGRPLQLQAQLLCLSLP